MRRLLYCSIFSPFLHFVLKVCNVWIELCTLSFVKCYSNLQCLSYKRFHSKCNDVKKNTFYIAFYLYTVLGGRKKINVIGKMSSFLVLWKGLGGSEIRRHVPYKAKFFFTPSLRDYKELTIFLVNLKDLAELYAEG